MTLLLGTGIRVSECVGLDLQDVNFDVCGIKIRRKGGYEAVIYFGQEVESLCWSGSESEAVRRDEIHGCSYV